VGHDWVLWVLVACTALHVVEERALGWQGWAAEAFGRRLGIVPTWLDFWATNGLLVVFAVSTAAVGWRAPVWALSLPALCLVNAVGFHVVPSLAAGRPNPGLFSACTLYLPISIWCYLAARQDGVLGSVELFASLALGAAAMAAAIGVLVLAKRYRYADRPEGETVAPPGVPAAGDAASV
jgi:uncharacterized protein with HXXEE motif